MVYFQKEDSENSRYQGSRNIFKLNSPETGGFATCTIVILRNLIIFYPKYSVERKSHISCDFRERGRKKAGQMGTECSKSQHFRIFHESLCFWVVGNYRERLLAIEGWA